MEGIKNLLVYIGLHGLGLIIGFLLIGILFTLKEHINKINWLIRLLLMPVVIFLAIITVSAISTNALALIAIFWYPGDAGFNVWIYSNIIIPGVTSYFLLWNVESPPELIIGFHDSTLFFWFVFESGSSYDLTSASSKQNKKGAISFSKWNVES